MNKNIKNNRGITLIALVITIIVMLILVGITIRISQEGSLFKHAANATSKTKIAAEKENEILSGSLLGDSIEDIVAEQTGSPVGVWHETGNGKITNGKYEVAIGDYVNYNCYNGTNYEEFGYEVTENSNTNMKWQVLGLENENLLIVAENPLDILVLSGEDGYRNGISKLNTISGIYGHGLNAVGARSINVDDVNKITEYDPMTAKDTPEGKKPYSYGYSTQYKNGPVTYEKTASNIICTYDHGTKTETYGNSSTKLLDLGATQNSTTLTIPESTYYCYDADIISREMPEFKLLFGDGTWENRKRYWLASTYVMANPGVAFWGMRAISPYSQAVTCIYLWRTISGAESGNYYGVRPVVLLKPGVKLKPATPVDGVNAWDFAP